ncbi:MAG: AAA family ATPase [Coriobacteriales bacterium]|nr:AAA family ATPase [Coriobacteriales bacterium]
MCNGMAGASGMPRVIDHAGRGRLPVGVEDFIQVSEDYAFVDKSLLIKELLELGAGRADLFCRPRRFGKSLALSMLRCFLEAPVKGWIEDQSELFRDLAISEYGTQVLSHQGAHPVVNINFKAASSSSWEKTKNAIAAQVAQECRRHWYLSDSSQLTPFDKQDLASLAAGDADNPKLEDSLSLLTRLLTRHHHARCAVLIDEYALPFSSHEATNFMRTWLAGGLKGNSDLFLGVLTGVQRVSKESIEIE